MKKIIIGILFLLLTFLAIGQNLRPFEIRNKQLQMAWGADSMYMKMGTTNLEISTTKKAISFSKSIIVDTAYFNVLSPAVPSLYWTLTGNNLHPSISTNYVNTDSSFYIHGYDIMRYNETYSSLSFGINAGFGNSGINSNFFGYNTGYNNTGSYFTGMGYDCGNGNTGINFIGYGRGVGIDNTGKNIMAFGINAGKNNTLDSALYIGYGLGTIADTNLTLLYGRNTLHKERLRVNGDLYTQKKLFIGADNTNSIEIDTAQGIKLNGTATVYDDLMFPFSTGTNGSAGYPAFNTDSMYYSFTVDSTGPSQCTMYFIVQMPHSWKAGSTVYPHIHYKQVGTNKPQFRVKYKWYNISEAGVTNWKWYVMNLGTSTTNNTQAMSYGTSGISGAGKTISSILIAKVYLYSLASGQTECAAYQFDVHIEKDGIGSKKELVK